MARTIETKDYSIFKTCSMNRPIDPSNLKKIKASLQANNLLEFDPIIVNSSMEVVDGQHRLEAAKELGIPIWYVINQSSGDEDIILLNAAKKSWSIDDYCNFYAKRGNSNYEKLIQFCQKHDIGIGKAIRAFFTNVSGSESVNYFRSGKFKFPDQEKIQEIEKSLEEMKIIITSIEKYCFTRKTMVTSSYFLRALSMLFNCHEFDSNVFLKKIALKADSLRACCSTSAYYKMFLDIYNFRNSKPIFEE